MTTQAAALPAGFEDLERYVDWAIPSENGRIQKRFDSSMEQITEYYNVMVERIEAVLDYLDTFDLDAMPEPEARLMNMARSLVEVANSVEVYGVPASPHSCGPDRFTARTVDLETAAAAG